MISYNDTHMSWQIYFYKIYIFQKKKKKIFLILKVNVLFFQCNQIFLYLASISREVDILIFFLVKFLCKNKLFVFLVVILYKKVCKDVILRRHIFIFLQIILQLSLRFIMHLKYKKMYIVNILSYLVFFNNVMLGRHNLVFLRQ